MKKLLFLLAFLTVYLTGSAQSPAPDANFPEPNNQVYAVQYDSVRNAVYIGGEFTIVGTSVRTRFASLDATTGALNTWNPAFNAAIMDFEIVDHYLYVVGSFTSAAGSPRSHAAKFDLTTKTLTSWSPSLIFGNSIEYSNGKIYISTSTGPIVRIDTANTATIDTWQPMSDGWVYALKIANGYLYAGGDYNTLDGQPRGNVAAFDLSTNPPTLDPWSPDADNRVNCIEYYSGNVYISGFFTAIASTPRSNLAEITAAENGPATATAWDPSTSSEVNRLKVKGNQLYYFEYPNPMREVYLPTHTATTWSVNFTANIAWSNLGFDISTTKAFIGGGWNLSYQGLARKNFGVVCAAPYSPVIDNLAVTLDPGIICHGAANIPFEVNSGTGASSYTWTTTPPTSTVSAFADSASISFSNTATTSSYTITIDGSNGCMPTNTASVTINAYTLSSTIAAQTTSMICGGKDTIVVWGNNYAGAGALSYSWSPGSSLNITSGDTIVSSAQADVTYTLTTTSTEGCVGKDSIYIMVNPFTPSVTHAAQTILCSLSDTMSIATDYPGAGTLTYTWSPTTSLDLTNAASPVASPVTSTTYTLMASASDGCAAVAQPVTVNVTPITVNVGASPSTITCGNTSTLSVSHDYPGTGTVTYTWSPAADLSSTSVANPVASPTISSAYYVDVLTPEGCFSSGNLIVYVNSLEVLTGGMHVSSCGNPVTLNTSNNSGNSNLTYSWSPAAGLSSASAAAPQASPAMTTTYVVTMSLPGSGCADAMAQDTVIINAPLAPGICAVTTDDSSANNIVYYDKTAYQPTDSFIVYRETTTNVYTKIATLAYAALSEYHDTARSIGPANGDPNIGTYRYKLAVKDSCGNISPMSPYHNSVFFVDNNTGTFTWNQYIVENATTPVTQFDLMRDNANNGVWILVGSVTGTQTTLNDPQYSSYQSIANWRVEAQGFNCTSTQRSGNSTAQGVIVKSKSNITNNRVIGIKENNFGHIFIYPNPTTAQFIVNLGAIPENTSVKVVSLLGEVVYKAHAQAGERLAIDLGQHADGVYLVHITTNGSTLVKRIIKKN